MGRRVTGGVGLRCIPSPSPRCKRSPKEWQEPSKGTQAVLSGLRQPACKKGRAQASVSAFATVDPRTGVEYRHRVRQAGVQI